MKQKILKIEDINIEEEYYPRTKCYWQTSYKYSQIMQAGTEFPPIEVAVIRRRFYLVDGRHRMEAHKLNKEEFIQAVINPNIRNFKQLYIEAVKRNVKHGEPLTVQDRTKIALKLQKMNFKDVEISRLIGVPVQKLEKYIADRVTNTVTGKTITLKPATSHVKDELVSENVEYAQENLSGIPQTKLLDDIIDLLDSSLIDLNNEKVVEKLGKIKELLKKLKV